MESEKKCCQEFTVVAEKIRTAAKVVDGIIYLDQQNRKYLTDWMEADEEEISNCSRCGVRVKKWIEENFVISASDLGK